MIVSFAMTVYPSGNVSLLTCGALPPRLVFRVISSVSVRLGSWSCCFASSFFLGSSWLLLVFCAHGSALCLSIDVYLVSLTSCLFLTVRHGHFGPRFTAHLFFFGGGYLCVDTHQECEVISVVEVEGTPLVAGDEVGNNRGCGSCEVCTRSPSVLRGGRPCPLLEHARGRRHGHPGAEVHGIRPALTIVHILAACLNVSPS